MKSQAAVEFLLTYGFAIAAVLIVFSTLIFFGVLSPQKFFPEYCIVEGGFHCSDYYLKEDSAMFLFTNNNGQTITSFNVNMSGCNPYFYQKAILAGEEVKISLNCANLGKVKDKVKYSFLLTYISQKRIPKLVEGEVKTVILK